MSTETIQQHVEAALGRELSLAEQATLAEPHNLGAYADLLDGVEGKLGRKLTEQERAVLTAQGRPVPLDPDLVTMQADRAEMPAVVQDLLDTYTAFLRTVTFGYAARYLDGPDKPVTGTEPQAISRAKFFAAFAVLFPVLFAVIGYYSWASQMHFAKLLPSMIVELPYQPIVLSLGMLFGSPILWQSLIGNQRVVRELPASDLFERLIDGDALFEEIYDKTPFPWRWICLGGPPRSQRGRAMLLVHYLDWFLGSCGLHFRWYWVQTALLIFALPALAVLSSKPIGIPPYTHSSLLIVLLSSFQPIVMLAGWITGQKAINAAALIKELRRRFGVIRPTPEEAAEVWRKRKLAAKRGFQLMGARKNWQESIKD